MNVLAGALGTDGLRRIGVGNPVIYALLYPTGTRASCWEELPKHGDPHLRGGRLQSCDLDPWIYTELLVMRGVGLGAPAWGRMPRCVCARLPERCASNPAVCAQGAGTEEGSVEPAYLRRDGFMRASSSGTFHVKGNCAAEVGTHGDPKVGLPRDLDTAGASVGGTGSIRIS